MKRNTFQGAAIAALAIGALLQQGCATMLKGTKEDVMVSSDPSGAQVSVNDQTGTTPFVTSVKSSEPLHIHVSKEGYQAEDITDDTSFRWGYEIWSFLAYIIPFGVDMADGAAWGHDQTMIASHLEPNPVGTAQTPPAVATAAAVQSDASKAPAIETPKFPPEQTAPRLPE